MISFFADDHYDAHPGRVIYDALPQELRACISFHENDWQLLSSGRWLQGCELLVLHLIGGTCGQPHADALAEKHIRQWCEQGGNLLLLHGSSAAFWEWPWWRKLMALRWVRGEDPDGAPESFHPVHPYDVTRCVGPNPLAARLREMSLPTDEIYANLAEQGVFETLLETVIPEGRFPQCVSQKSPWGGTIIHFLPGHYACGAGHPDLVYNVKVLIEELRK